MSLIRSVSTGALALGLVFGSAATAGAQVAGVVHDPLNMAELVRNGVREEHNLAATTTLVHQNLTQLRNEAANLTSAPAAFRGQLTSDLRSLGSVMDGAQGVSMKDRNYASQFSDSFPTYKPGANFSTAYSAWSTNTRTAALRALQAAGITARSDATMAQNMERLAERSDTATGALSAAQVGNNISLQMSEQLAKLRMLQQAQVQSETAFYLNANGTSAGAVQAANGGDLKAWLARSKDFRSNQIRNRSVTP